MGRIEARHDPDGPWRIYSAPHPARTYAIGVDPSSGEPGKDYAAMQVLDTVTFQQVATFQSYTDPGELGLEAVRAALYYNSALLVPEVNNHGIATLAAIEREGYDRVFRRIDQAKVAEDGHILGKTGWETNRATKPLACNALKDFLRDRSITLVDRATIEELRCFGYLNEEAPSSMYGLGAVVGHDDLVMALALALMGVLQAGAPADAIRSLNRSVGDALIDEATTLMDALEADLEGDPWVEA